jgi:multicomponent Na+:H+ antiporter subunit D
MFTPIILLAAITVIIGFYAEPFFDIANNAAAQLLNPDKYISTVLGL